MPIPSSHTVVIDDRAFFACVRVYGFVPCLPNHHARFLCETVDHFVACTARQGIKSSGETGWNEERVVKRPNLLILQFLNLCV